MEIQIGMTVKNKVTGKMEVVKTIKHGYINNYRADLFEIVDASIKNDNTLPDALLTSVVFGQAKWNKKFYGKCIYVDNKKYELSYNQMEELSRHFQVEF